MTSSTPRPPVDLELLADYVCDLLDDTERSRVGALVRDDPHWSEAHRALLAADPLIAAELADLADEPTPMPPDVLARITESLPGAGSPAPPDQPAPSPTPTPPDQPASVRSLADARRRRYRVAGWLSAAAVAVILVGLGGAVGLGGLGGHTGQGTSQRAADRRPGPDQGHADAGSPTVGAHANRQPGVAPTGGASGHSPTTARVASGTDYRPGTLPGAAGLTGAAVLDRAARSRVPAGLNRLVSAAELHRCLAAVTAAVPGTARLVDYARFRGDAALVVVLTTGADGRVVVAGPGCGPRGPDIRYQTGR